MKKNDMTSSIIKIIAAIIVLVVVVILCINFFDDKDKQKGKNENKEIVKYITDNSKVSLNGGNTDFVTNEKCKSSAIKKRFSLKIDNGSILVNNLDTMENFLMESITNVSTMIEFNYEKTCDTAMYAILTNEGLVFYTYDDVTKATDIRRIEDKFTLLKSDLRFSELSLGEENGETNLYGKTAAGYLYKIDLR